MLFVVSADPGATSLRGQVVASDGQSPLAGARVHLDQVQGTGFYTSAWTTDDGGFEIDGLAPAKYRVAVEADGGLYLVDAPLTMASGQDRTLRLAVNPDTRDKESDEDTPAAAARGWSNPLTATLLVLGAAIGGGLLIDALDDDDGGDQTTSPSAP